MRGFGGAPARLLLGALISLSLVLPAQARWLRAETDKFVVYGEGGERAIREFATNWKVKQEVKNLCNRMRQKVYVENLSAILSFRFFKEVYQ